MVFEMMERESLHWCSWLGKHTFTGVETLGAEFLFTFFLVLVVICTPAILEETPLGGIYVISQCHSLEVPTSCSIGLPNSLLVHLQELSASSPALLLNIRSFALEMLRVWEGEMIS